MGSGRRRRQRLRHGVPLPRPVVGPDGGGRSGLRRRGGRDPGRRRRCSLGERPDAAGLGRASPSRCRPSGWWRATPPGRPAASPGGVVDGALAGLGFGFLFVALGPGRRRRRPAAPRRQPGGRGRWSSCWSRPRCGQPWRPTSPAAPGRRLAGSLGAVATVCFLLATREGYLSVASVRDLALPGGHRGPRRDRAPRARPPRPGSRSAAVRGGRDARRGRVADDSRRVSGARRSARRRPPP